MATRPFITDDDSVEGFLPADRPQAANRINRYQLHVVGSHMADVVQSTGGWLCDRARADPVQHQMSCAARAFKAHALGAAAVSNDSIAPTETLFRIGTGSFRPLYSV